MARSFPISKNGKSAKTDDHYSTPLNYFIVIHQHVFKICASFGLVLIGIQEELDSIKFSFLSDLSYRYLYKLIGF